MEGLTKTKDVCFHSLTETKRSLLAQSIGGNSPSLGVLLWWIRKVNLLSTNGASVEMAVLVIFQHQTDNLITRLSLQVLWTRLQEMKIGTNLKMMKPQLNKTAIPCLVLILACLASSLTPTRARPTLAAHIVLARRSLGAAQRPTLLGCMSLASGATAHTTVLPTCLSFKSASQCPDIAHSNCVYSPS